MTINLTKEAGFPLYFDPDRMEVETAGGIRFEKEARYFRQMQDVLKQPDSLAADEEFYWNLKLVEAGSCETLYRRLRMTFGLVLLPPKRAGVEYVKTHGHYHSPIPDASIAYSEVYTHYFGKMYLYMQRRREQYPDELDDCVLYEMIPGDSITIPPGYAHILINPSDGPALMGGLYSEEAQYMYGPIREMGGGAYYLIADDGKECFIPNSRYAAFPTLRKITNFEHTPFAPPDPTLALWPSFVHNPELYAFIYDSYAASSYFLPEDQRL